MIKTNVLPLLWLLSSTLAPNLANSATQPIDKIEAYGVYVVADTGYVKVSPYQHNDRFVDFKYLAEIPSVKRADQGLKLIVFNKDFSESNFLFELRPVQTVVDIKEVKFSTKPLADKDMYELTLEGPVPDGTMLHVYSGYFFFDTLGAIMLGDTQEQLVTYFKRDDLKDAYAVDAYLDDALKAFPANGELKKLKAHWAGKAEEEKDLRDYGYVEEKWRQYQETEKLKLKVRYLEQMMGEINGYLRDHPNGAKAKEAKERAAYAERKIPEYQKQI